MEAESRATRGAAASRANGEGAIRFRKPFENLNFGRRAERASGGARGSEDRSEARDRRAAETAVDDGRESAGAMGRRAGGIGRAGEGLTATRARNRQVETEEGKEDALGRGRRVRTAKRETGDDGRKRELDARGVVDAETGEFGGERAGVEGERDDDGFGVERARRAGAASRGEANAQEAVERVR